MTLTSNSKPTTPFSFTEKVNLCSTEVDNMSKGTIALSTDRKDNTNETISDSDSDEDNISNSSLTQSKTKDDHDNDNDQEHEPLNRANNEHGRWTTKEHQLFIEGLGLYGNEWKMVQEHIKTRSATQSRSHAQKYFIRLRKKLCNETDSNVIKQRLQQIFEEETNGDFKVNDPEVFYDQMVQLIYSYDITMKRYIRHNSNSCSSGAYTNTNSNSNSHINSIIKKKKTKGKYIKKKQRTKELSTSVIDHSIDYTNDYGNNNESSMDIDMIKTKNKEAIFNISKDKLNKRQCQCANTPLNSFINTNDSTIIIPLPLKEQIKDANNEVNQQMMMMLNCLFPQSRMHQITNEKSISYNNNKYGYDDSDGDKTPRHNPFILDFNSMLPNHGKANYKDDDTNSVLELNDHSLNLNVDDFPSLFRL